MYRDQPYLASDPRFIIADMGVHLLDLARFFLGEVERLYCVTQRVNPSIRGEDVATVLLRTENRACNVELSYATRAEEESLAQTMAHLEGAHGVADLGPNYLLTVTRREENSPRAGGAAAPPMEHSAAGRAPGQHPSAPPALGGVPHHGPAA